MHILKTLKFIHPLLRVKFFNERIPLMVGWALTYKCNNRCLYCGAWNENFSEINTAKAKDIIKELSSLGTQWISFTGGEPLLRNDLGEIIQFAQDKKIQTSINTSGTNLSQKIHSLKNLNQVKISLDGPQIIQDKLRGEGSFKTAIDALEICHQHSIPALLGCVLSKYNLNYIQELFKIATKYKTKISFQPTTTKILRQKVLNEHIPDIKEYRETIEKLIADKKDGYPIYNSITGLKYIYHYPNYKHINCYAGRLIFRIEPDGTILPCDRHIKSSAFKGSNHICIKDQINNCELPKDCGNCWCSSMTEANYLFDFNFNVLTNLIKHHFN